MFVAIMCNGHACFFDRVDGSNDKSGPAASGSS